MRVSPRPWIGIAVWVGYVVIVTVVGALSGVGYNNIGDSAETLFRSAGLFLGIGAVYLVIVTTILGWWRPALFERARSRHRWPIVAPAIMALSVAIALPAVDWSRIDGGYLAGLLTLGILVGFNEELVTRGLLLTGLRAEFREVWVWLTTSALFGLMHATNIISGAPVAQTLQQVVLAFLGGTAFYITRRVTGSLIWAMALHGLWDFTTFATGHGTVGPSFGLFLGVGGEVLALVVVWWTFANAERRTVATEAQ
ncbi:CPBP family intramembrane glutamic endopeptidase [Leifsonia sp. RAF41]|uniref:CPBP family intramembrane glutamic endopeptidase n=1 Tax=Leifsonia sp. RAF41 TaxID=3233056 RepID=UPI003F9D3231